MKAKFIGITSMGFVHGNVYDIKHDVKCVPIHGKYKTYVCIYDKNSKEWCPYQNFEAVLKNWSFNFFKG